MPKFWMHGMDIHIYVGIIHRPESVYISLEVSELWVSFLISIGTCLLNCLVSLPEYSNLHYYHYNGLK